nr:hypothetical protein GCM10020093_059900 [Planobispora longispora]
MTDVRVATVRSTPTGSAEGSRVAVYPVTISRARPRQADDCSASRKPSPIHPLPRRTPAISGLRRSYGSRHQAARALCTLTPTLLWAHLGPRCGAAGPGR